MAGNTKQKRKTKKKVSRGQQPKKVRTAPRRSVAQLVFIGFGVLIILSMVISLVANFGAF